jgi:hypothetical protein
MPETTSTPASPPDVPGLAKAVVALAIAVLLVGGWAVLCTL